MEAIIPKFSIIVFKREKEKGDTPFFKTNNRCIDLSVLRLFISNKLAVFGGKTVAIEDIYLSEMIKDKEFPCYSVVIKKDKYRYEFYEK